MDQMHVMLHFKKRKNNQHIILRTLKGFIKCFQRFEEHFKEYKNIEVPNKENPGGKKRANITKTTDEE